ncbi:MAG: hypothetical protein KatS3mg061_2695 [Dehalococcoidia bacterium]|nr:MAG: hypothetical protein KatS3mg061_2695 [Dehalococcoidia bacterium]
MTFLSGSRLSGRCKLREWTPLPAIPPTYAAIATIANLVDLYVRDQEGLGWYIQQALAAGQWEESTTLLLVADDLRVGLIDLLAHLDVPARSEPLPLPTAASEPAELTLPAGPAPALPPGPETPAAERVLTRLILQRPAGLAAVQEVERALRHWAGVRRLVNRTLRPGEVEFMLECDPATPPPDLSASGLPVKFVAREPVLTYLWQGALGAAAAPPRFLADEGKPPRRETGRAEAIIRPLVVFGVVAGALFALLLTAIGAWSVLGDGRSTVLPLGGTELSPQDLQGMIAGAAGLIVVVAALAAAWRLVRPGRRSTL